MQTVRDCWECESCGYVWLARSDAPPSQCGKCKSRHWNVQGASTGMVNPSLEDRVSALEVWRHSCGGHKVKPLIIKDEPMPQSKGKVARAKRKQREAKAIGGGFTQVEFKALCHTYNERCLRCGTNAILVPDHVKPLFLGGRHAIDNIQPLCSACNIWKKLMVIDFRADADVLQGIPIAA